MTGLHRDRHHFYSWNGEPAVPGITSIIGVLDKPKLPAWAAGEAGLGVLQRLDLIDGHKPHVTKEPDCPICQAGKPWDHDGQARLLSWIKGLPYASRDKAGNVGTLVHSIAEDLALGRVPEVPEGLEDFARSFIRDFVEKYKPKFHPLYVEYRVYHEGDDTVMPYGGTGDLICRIDDDVVLIDHKTTASGVYPETALQLAAARYAGFIGREGDPKKYAIPKVDRCGVLWLRPDHAEFIDYDVTPREFQAFADCRRTWDWVNVRSKVVMGGKQ